MYRAELVVVGRGVASRVTWATPTVWWHCYHLNYLHCKNKWHNALAVTDDKRQKMTNVIVTLTISSSSCTGVLWWSRRQSGDPWTRHVTCVGGGDWPVMCPVRVGNERNGTEIVWCQISWWKEVVEWMSSVWRCNLTDTRPQSESQTVA